MTNYLIRLSYDGSKYYGFQRIRNYPCIQSEVEKAISKVCKEKIRIKGAGRTDKGVHALDQCASFSSPLKINCESMKRAINRYLPMDIRVNSCLEVADDFHARFSVKKKIYEYKIYLGEYNPLLVNYYYQPKEKINIRKIRKSAKVFIGLHDFKNFVSGAHDNTKSQIYKIRIFKRNNILTIRIVGTSFYKYMVRNIVGALLDYNKEKVTLCELKKMVEDVANKKQLTTAVPYGLYLTKIYY